MSFPDGSFADDSFSRFLEFYFNSYGNTEDCESNTPFLNQNQEDSEYQSSPEELFEDAIRQIADPENAFSESDIGNLVALFINLYKEREDGSRFRHSYSVVASVIYQPLAKREPDTAIPAHLGKLENDISLILKEVRSKDASSRATVCLEKLRDHIELERERLNYMMLQNEIQREHAEKLDSRLLQFEKELDKKVTETASVIDDAKDRIEDAQRKAQRDSIATLGIFAAIVITFFSGLAFTSSVLENIDKASIYRLSFMALIIGLFVINLVCALFVFLNKVSNINSSAMKWVLFGANTVFLILIIAVVVARACDIVSQFPVL